MGRMARNTARRLGALVLLLLVALPGTAGAEDEADAKTRRSPAELAAARYARELLVRRALESVRPDRMEEDGIARTRDEVKLRREEFLEIHRPSVAQVDDLINGAPGRGLIGEAARLYAWMAYMPPPPSHDAEDAERAEKRLHPIIVYRGTEERPDFGALVPRPGEEELSRDAKAQLALGRGQASVRLRDKRLDVMRREDGLVAIGAADKVRFLDLALASIRSGKTSKLDDETAMPATWLALTDRHELSSRMSHAYIAAREIQVRERLAEFSTDVAPAGLVSERAYPD